jgi:uncharacterized damage-inducible protein DinB
MSTERADLLDTLRDRRAFLRRTVRDLGDEAATRRSTASDLCLGGLIKHVARTEQRWLDFAVDGAGMRWADDDWGAEFRMEPGETLAGQLAYYEQVASRTDDLITTLELDQAHPLPKAPWFEPDASWTVRRVLLHVIAETAHHAGHADILRESIDGARTMG